MLKGTQPADRYTHALMSFASLITARAIGDASRRLALATTEATSALTALNAFSSSLSELDGVIEAA